MSSRLVNSIKTQISHEKHQKEELQKTLLKMQDRLKKVTESNLVEEV